MRIKIDDGPVVALKDIGIEVIESPQAYFGSIKSNNIIEVDFPEEDGSTFFMPANPRLEAFDYTVTFAQKKVDSQSLSVKVGAFISSLMGKDITIYNDEKGVAVRGFVTGSTDDKYYPSAEVAFFKVTFKIPNPTTISRY